MLLIHFFCRQSLGTSFTVSTTEFRRDLIFPRQSYTYSLVASYNDWVQQACQGSLLPLLLSLSEYSEWIQGELPARSLLLDEIETE